MLPVSVLQDSGRLKQNLQVYLIEILSSKQSVIFVLLHARPPSSGYLLRRFAIEVKFFLGA